MSYSLLEGFRSTQLLTWLGSAYYEPFCLHQHCTMCCGDRLCLQSKRKGWDRGKWVGDTWLLLCLAVEIPWLTLDGPFLFNCFCTKVLLKCKSLCKAPFLELWVVFSVDRISLGKSPSGWRHVVAELCKTTHIARNGGVRSISKAYLCKREEKWSTQGQLRASAAKHNTNKWVWFESAIHKSCFDSSFNCQNWKVKFFPLHSI